jgi:EAL domain-containing protein (putative c-di-GMP-specific phosphodiesterase class I)
VLVLPHVARNRLILLSGGAVAFSVAILVLDQAADQLPAIAGLAGVIFQDAILVGVLILVLAGLADFAMAARDSLRDLHESATRQIRITAARASNLDALRRMHALPTPEATAASIATSLNDLPFVDVALVLEAAENGMFVLAASGDQVTLGAGDQVPLARAAYLLERSQHGAWAELRAIHSAEVPVDERFARLGIKGQAFAPILAGDQVVALVSIGTADDDQANHLIADLPSVSEAAAVAGAILAPALLARREVRSIKTRIAGMIASGAFHPVFQPIVDLETGSTVGFESLTRFSTGEAPDRVFADAARAGLGMDLEVATLIAAVRDAARLPAGTWLSLNVSPTLLAERIRLTGVLAYRTRPIVLEITEHEIIEDYAPLHAALRSLGPDVRLAVDDAGAGVANFKHLVDLRPDLVKIDAGLVRGVNADVSRQALIVGLVHFGAVSGAQVLAEGLETEAEQETVQRLGVTLGQGYRLARPAAIGNWTVEPRIAPALATLAPVIPIREALLAH